MLLMRFRARRRTRKRGERGKLERVEMSLSVRSMASDWSCVYYLSFYIIIVYYYLLSGIRTLLLIIIIRIFVFQECFGVFGVPGF